MELSCEEICKELNLTSTNLYGQLHRARLRLRECLELNWFGRKADGSTSFFDAPANRPRNWSSHGKTAP